MSKSTIQSDQISENHETPPSASTAAKATRVLSKPGHTRKAIHITDAAWERIVSHVDANDLDLDKFLTRQMTKIADSLA